ncbi:MAG: TraR/DksA family transcriptional regulator [Gammaproteobacteria bacterium]|nr:TraR/DksA family transcriptional regulator [Gammaproteobacteria bacterium]
MSKAITAEQMAALRVQLQQRRQQLLGDIQEELLQTEQAHLQTLAGAVHDRGEEAVSTLLQDVDTVLVQKHRQELMETEQALAKMERGEYGFCAECGEYISLKRLQAQPAAARCIVCQQLREK